MKIITVLHERFGFTRSEVFVIVVLAAALLAGAVIRRLSPTGPPAPRFDYSQSDSEYTARIRALALLAPPRSAGDRAGDPGRAGGGGGAAGKTLPARGSTDINHADSAALVRLPGIGPAYARRIIAYRIVHGRFARVEDLAKVKGIGPAKLEKLKPYIVLR